MLCNVLGLRERSTLTWLFTSVIPGHLPGTVYACLWYFNYARSRWGGVFPREVREPGKEVSPNAASQAAGLLLWKEWDC